MSRVTVQNCEPWDEQNPRCFFFQNGSLNGPYVCGWPWLAKAYMDAVLARGSLFKYRSFDIFCLQVLLFYATVFFPACRRHTTYGSTLCGVSASLHGIQSACHHPHVYIIYDIIAA